VVGARQRRRAVDLLKARDLTERRACDLVGIGRSSYRYESQEPDDTELRERLIEIARENPRYGYRRAWALLRRGGLRINHKRVYRLWKDLGLGVPRRKKRKRHRSGDSVPRAAEHPNHVWTYDFFYDAYTDGRQLKILAVLDEYTRVCLAIEVGTSIRSKDVMAVLERLFLEHGSPGFIRSDNGPEFIAKALSAWLERQNTGTIFIEPGSPWQNGYAESFGDKLRWHAPRKLDRQTCELRFPPQPRR